MRIVAYSVITVNRRVENEKSTRHFKKPLAWPMITNLTVSNPFDSTPSVQQTVDTVWYRQQFSKQQQENSTPNLIRNNKNDNRKKINNRINA